MGLSFSFTKEVGGLWTRFAPNPGHEVNRFAVVRAGKLTGFLIQVNFQKKEILATSMLHIAEDPFFV
jgi:hypothetical protein